MKKLLIKIKNYFKSLNKFDYIRFLISIILIYYSFTTDWLIWVLLVVTIIAVIVVLISNAILRSRARGNGILYGGRGKGKGIILNHLIIKDNTIPFVNVPYGRCFDSSRNVIINTIEGTETPYVEGMKYDSELLLDINEYFNSIAPLNIEDFINGIDKTITKNNKFEKRNVYIDDINVYMPNWADSLLKKKYESMPPFLAINRHLYDAYCVITTQSRERPYKILKELQEDFSIKAIKTVGWSKVFQIFPILRHFVYTKYIYHELAKSSDMLPFKAVGAVNETLKHGYLTSGQATKEVYEATNGKIRYGFVLQLKKNINYDTRFFHQVVYGKKAPK